MIDPFSVETTLDAFLSYPSPQHDMEAVRDFVARAVRPRIERLSYPAPFFYRRAALDAGYLMSMGIPAIMWGPGNPALAHTDEERVRVDDVVAGAEAYRELTSLACWDQPRW